MITVWTLVVTAPYLNFDPAAVPSGREYLSTIQHHHFWTWVKQCGPCAFWNGSVIGGVPALPDPYGSTLHPLVATTALVWGVPNGAKLALVGAFLMAGLAQWWLGRVFGLGRLACVWSACMAVAAGNLAGRMDLGAFAMVVSTAACAVVWPPLVLVMRTASRRAAVLLGVALGLAIISGQGYMQIALAFTLPVALVLLPRDTAQLRLRAKRLALAAGIALPLAAPMLVPFLHFQPYFYKDSDATFKSAQPLQYAPLNLVINDKQYYFTENLGRLPYPTVYVNYVGWIPVILAVAALGRLRASASAEQRVILFLAALAVIALWVSSAAPFALLAQLGGGSAAARLFTSIRYPSMMAGLAIPGVLGLAAITLDRIVHTPWPRLTLSLGLTPGAGGRVERTFAPDLRWVLALPLLFALANEWAFSRAWIATERLNPSVTRVLEALRTPDLQWVDQPFGEHFWVEASTGMGLKLSSGIHRWKWNGRALPESALVASREGPRPGMTPLATMEGIVISAALAGREYAAVEGAGQRTVCAAHGVAGDVDVVCDAPHPGVLTVKENSWTGWGARVEGRPATLLPGQWLALELPAGRHTISFRYRPWDAFLGLLLCLAGAVLAAYSWWRGETPGGSATGGDGRPSRPADAVEDVQRVPA
ncbi:MAG: hypothetical protein HY332_20725 [Chloroflexi bacterium]|nr:hypothetical protein [Chloroflexota bacterium]